MGLITENWSARTFVRGKSAHREFVASGYNDEESVRSACPVQLNDGLNLDTRLLAGEPSISRSQGLSTYTVSVDYAPSGNGGSDSTTTDEALLKTPPTYFPDLQETSEPIDRDAYGNPITNSAGDPPSQNVQDTFTSIFYTYKRYEARYDGQKALAYSNRVNSDKFSMPGFGDVDPGQALCKSIRAANEYDRKTKAVLIIYSFEIREDGFKLRILDKGRRAWGAGDIFDDIYIANTNGEKVSEDVLLDGYGIPVKSDKYKIGSAKATPAKNFQVSQKEVDRESKLTPLGRTVHLKYTRKKSIAFSGLNLEP